MKLIKLFLFVTVLILSTYQVSADMSEAQLNVLQEYGKNLVIEQRYSEITALNKILAGYFITDTQSMPEQVKTIGIEFITKRKQELIETSMKDQIIAMSNGLKVLFDSLLKSDSAQETLLCEIFAKNYYTARQKALIKSAESLSKNTMKQNISETDQKKLRSIFATNFWKARAQAISKKDFSGEIQIMIQNLKTLYKKIRSL